jgi:osmotically-inducible protein OsmY
VKQELTVKLLPLHLRTDLEIKAAAENALLWDVFIPSGLTVKVADGRVTLAGNVTWNFQRESAERAVRYLMGVISVKNDLSLNPQANTSQVKEKVAAALKRQATADSQSIQVETSGNKVTLSGNASSWQMIQDATSAAWAAPGVNEVVEHIGIR